MLETCVLDLDVQGVFVIYICELDIIVFGMLVFGMNVLEMSVGEMKRCVVGVDVLVTCDFSVTEFID